MAGFLLADDAISARKQQFDDWVGEQKRNAEQAAAQAQQAVQARVQQDAAAVQARAQEFQSWVAQQQQQRAADALPPAQPPAAPAMPMASTLQPSTPPAVGVDQPPEQDPVAARAKQFSDWIAQQTQQATQPSPAQPTVPTQQQGPPSLPPAEEPATHTDTVGPALGGKWKTSFDHGATYTGSYRTGTPHRGIDLVPNQGGIGTAVEAFQPGTVTNISRDSGAGGLMVYVQDDQGLTHAYMHLDGTAPGLQVGQKVGRGQRIATMGESGTEGSPHLHYEVRKNAATGDPLDQLIDPRPYIAGQEQKPGTTPPSRFNPTGKTTAELSGGGAAGGMTERAQSIMAEAGQAAAAFGGDAAKAVQSVLVTEGGLNNARGDSGSSAGPLQFFGEEGGRAGQLNNFARDIGVPLEDARKWIEQNPVAAVKWALGSPDSPGYLGRALLDGIQKGLSGADLATHIQRVGQVSVSPERAGANFLSLFGQGQEAIRSAGASAVESALEAGRRVEGRAGELVREGEQLVQRGQDKWSQLDQMQAQTRADSERWFNEQRARGEEWDTRRQRQDLDWQRSMNEQLGQFQENARGFTAPIAEGAGTAWDFLSGETARRNREAFGQRTPATEDEQAAARAQIGQMMPTNLLEAAGGLFRGAPGSAAGGAMTIPEWQELERRRKQDVSGFVRENVPGGDAPVLGGALQMAAEEATSPLNLVLAGPLMGVGRGVAALVGGGTRGAIADWAIQGGIFAALTEASSPDATPESVGEAFATGVAGGGVIRGAGALAAPLAGRAATAGRQLLNSPEFQRVLRSGARGEAEVGFAAGLPTGGRLPDVEPPVAPSRRMFHGTSAEFETPGRFDDNGLFGPGYYLTNDPRVAGGIVGEGRPALQSQLDELRAIVSNPATSDRRRYVTQLDIADLERQLSETPANVVREGYAQGSAGTARAWTQPAIDDAQRTVERLRGALAGRPADDARWPMLRAAEQRLSELSSQLPNAGPNVRAVDVPSNLNLFDADAPLDIPLLDRITSLLDPDDARALTSSLPYKTGRPDKWTNDVLYRKLSEIVDPPYANKLLQELGFDGVTHAGGKRVPMADEVGEPIEHAVNVIFPEALPKIRNAFSGRQGGFASAPFAARLGGAGVGGYAGWETAPEEERKPAFNVGPVEVPSGMRVGRAIVGGGAGLAAPGVAQAALTRTQLRQDMLERLRSAGIAAAAPAPSRPVGLDVATAVDVTKQAILSDPVGRVMDLVGNTIELLRQPIALTMGGQGPEAAAGIGAIMRGLPEAFQNAVQALQGRQVATLGQGAQDIGKSKPIFRILAAGDLFTRTLGEYQGIASRAVAMLNKAGLKPGTAEAEEYLVQHADELYREGAKSGTTSVFGSAQRGANASPLDKLMSSLSDAKEGLLNSPRKRDQALGALLDLNIPFSGTPSRVLQIGLQRIPGITQAAGAARIAKALQKGDSFAAQKALGEVTTETLIQLRIAQGISEGNITGPDDPEHPSSIQINGQWMPLRTLGVYGMPAGIMAAFAESWEKTGREPDQEATERFAAALNASMEPLLDAVPGFALMNTFAAMGRGGFTGAVERQAQDAIGRLTSPALLSKAENMLDPYMRDVHKRGWESLHEPTMAKNPLLARFLPPKLDPTTGEPMARGFSLLGGQAKVSTPIRTELARLKREGYDLNPPTDKPSSITIRGVPVPVKDGSPEQRAMVAARGQFLAETGEQMTKPSYAKMSDDQKAKFWSRMIDRSARLQTRAWQENVDPERAGRILGRGKRVVGRLQDVEDEDELINRQVAITTAMRRQQQRSA